MNEIFNGGTRDRAAEVEFNSFYPNNIFVLRNLLNMYIVKFLTMRFVDAATTNRKKS